MIKKAYALTGSDLGVDVFTEFTSFTSIYGFIFNLIVYIGWAMVFVGIAYALSNIIYRLMNMDSEEAVKEYRGAVIKTILISVLGLFLVNVQAIFTIVASIFGLTLQIKF